MGETLSSPDPILLEAQEVVETAYGLPEADIDYLGNGIINQTMLVRHAGEKNVLQRLHRMFPTELSNDFQAVTDFLAGEGWQVPRLIRTDDDRNFYRSADSSHWRMMSFINSDPHRPATLSHDDYAKVGNLLGRLHTSLGKFDYTPEYGIPHFHDTPFYATRMQEVAAELPDDATKQLADDMLHALAELPDMPMDTPQLIHGDPQTSNILFKDGQPFTFIDFDTVMSASIWIDLGDMLRSLAEDAVEGGGEFPSDMLRAVCDGYRKAAAPGMAGDEFYAWSLAALQKIALELGMRFLTDVVDDEYFEYDKSRFASRLESNLYRSDVQWQLYNLCNDERQQRGL